MKPSGRTVLGRSALALLPLTFVVFLVCAGLEAEELKQAKLSALNNGERATGTIISRQVFHSPNEGDTFLVKYTFTPLSGQEQIIGYHTFYDSFPDGWDVGATLEIAYDRQDHDINVPVNAEYKNDTSLGGAWFGITLFSVVAFIMTFQLGRWVLEAWKLNKPAP